MQYHSDKETVHRLSLAMRSLHSVTERLAVAETRQKETDIKLVETEKQQVMTKKEFEKKQEQTDRKFVEAVKRPKETKDKLAAAERTQNRMLQILFCVLSAAANLSFVSFGLFTASTNKQALESELKSLKSSTFFITLEIFCEISRLCKGCSR